MPRPIVKKIIYSLPVIVLICTLSYPIYGHYQVVARRHRVVMALKGLVNRMNEYYSLQGNYKKANAHILNLDEFNKIPGYKLQIVRHANQHFTLSATPVGEQSEKDKNCGTLSLTDSGGKYITGPGSVKDCWFL